MEQHGGKRPRAGRKIGSLASHTLAAQEIRCYLIGEVIKEMRPIIKALIKKAKEGDVPALREVLERTLGRVKDQYDTNEESKAQELKKIQDGVRALVEMAKKNIHNTK